MANPIITTLNKIGDTVQYALSGPNPPTPAPTARTSTGQTCLEYTGMRLRRDHLRQNTWRKDDIEYSRPLILAEYEIQTEFKISTTAEQIAEEEQLAEQRRQEKEAKAAEKQRQKLIKKQKKINDAAAKQKGVPANKQPGGINKTEPVETTVPASKQRDGAVNTALKWADYVISQLPPNKGHDWAYDELRGE